MDQPASLPVPLEPHQSMESVNVALVSFIPINASHYALLDSAQLEDNALNALKTVLPAKKHQQLARVA